MNPDFEYKGQFGSLEVQSDGMLCGRLLGVLSVIAYSAESTDGLRLAFHEAVDDYINICTSHDDKPEIPWGYGGIKPET